MAGGESDCVWESSRLGALPTGPTGVGIFGGIPPVDLWATRGSFTRRAWRAPDGVMLEHRIEDGEQLAHHGSERNLGGFAAPPQPAVKGG